jgi:hypothetical protein
MPQSNDPVAKALAGAKATLAHANATFPSSGAPKAAATPAPAVAPKKASMSIGEPEKGTANELKSKAEMVGKAKTALGDAPKMHKGGPVKKSGTYQLQAGEHVLTAPEAKTARKHALMMSGMKSLAKAAK